MLCIKIHVFVGQGPRSRWGGGGARWAHAAPPAQYFENYKELVRKIVLCPPNIESLMCPPPPSQNCSAVPVGVAVTCSYTIQYNTIQYNTIQYNTIQYNTIPYHTIQYNTIQYKLVTQCFRVEYRGIRHASLVVSVYTRAFRGFRRVCIRKKYK